MIWQCYYMLSTSFVAQVCSFRLLLRAAILEALLDVMLGHFPIWLQSLEEIRGQSWTFDCFPCVVFFLIMFRHKRKPRLWRQRSCILLQVDLKAFLVLYRSNKCLSSRAICKNDTLSIKIASSTDSTYTTNPVLIYQLKYNSVSHLYSYY